MERGVRCWLLLCVYWNQLCVNQVSDFVVKSNFYLAESILLRANVICRRRRVVGWLVGWLLKLHLIHRNAINPSIKSHLCQEKTSSRDLSQYAKIQNLLIETCYHIMQFRLILGYLVRVWHWPVTGLDIDDVNNTISLHDWTAWCH